MLIDVHTHSFPEKIAAKAIEKLSYVSGALMPQTDGTLSGLKAIMKKEGVTKSVLLSIATNAHQQKAVNDFAKAAECDEIIPFGSVYPYADDAFSELERLKSLGFKGIKLHPEYQNFFVDDEKLKPLYKKISELGFVLIFHAGEDYGYKSPFRATPERLRTAAKWIDAPIIAAHWGSAGMGEDVIKYLTDVPMYFDTAFGYGTMPRERAMRILEKRGVENILFGSDCPWNAPSWDVNMIKTLELTNSELDDIFYKNAVKLLRLGES